MNVSRAVDHLCLEEKRIDLAVRRAALARLALIVATTLAAHAYLSRAAAGSPGAWLDAAVLVAVPMLAAWSVDRIAGRRVYAAAAVMITGYCLPLLFSAPDVWLDNASTHAYVAAGMTWIFGTDPKLSTRTMLAGASILAVASAVATLI